MPVPTAHRLDAMGARLVVLALLLVAGSCAGSRTIERGVPNPFGQNPEESGEIQIRIRNFNFSDATVWVLEREGKRTRLGVVTGKSDSTFSIPWTFSAPMRVEFDLLAGVRCLTESLDVDPGDILELQISVDPSSDPQCMRR